MARGAHRPADAVDDVLDGAAAVELARERLHEARAVSRDDAVPHLVRVRVSVRAGSGYGVRARVRARDRARDRAGGSVADLKKFASPSTSAPAAVEAEAAAAGTGACLG